MKLFPLNPTQRLAINLQKISRKLKIQAITMKSDDNLKDIVIITTGTPDDIVFSIIAYHQNGRKIIGIVKPEKTRLGAIDSIPKYIKHKIKNLMIIIDQEDEELKNLFAQVEKKFSSIGIRASLKDTRDRVRLYKCTYATNNINIILVINGLDDIKTKMHTIEDHLIKAHVSLRETLCSKNHRNSITQRISGIV